MALATEEIAMYSNKTVMNYIMCQTWFWKTDQVVTLILEIPILIIQATVVSLC